MEKHQYKKSQLISESCYYKLLGLIYIHGLKTIENVVFYYDTPNYFLRFSGNICKATLINQKYEFEVEQVQDNVPPISFNKKIVKRKFRSHLLPEYLILDDIKVYKIGCLYTKRIILFSIDGVEFYLDKNKYFEKNDYELIATFDLCNQTTAQAMLNFLMHICNSKIHTFSLPKSERFFIEHKNIKRKDKTMNEKIITIPINDILKTSAYLTTYKDDERVDMYTSVYHSPSLHSAFNWETHAQTILMTIPLIELKNKIKDYIFERCILRISALSSVSIHYLTVNLPYKMNIKKRQADPYTFDIDIDITSSLSLKENNIELYFDTYGYSEVILLPDKISNIILK